LDEEVAEQGADFDGGFDPCGIAKLLEQGAYYDGCD